jgi:hypothetical protein
VLLPPRPTKSAARRSVPFTAPVPPSKSDRNERRVRGYLIACEVNPDWGEVFFFTVYIFCLLSNCSLEIY